MPASAKAVAPRVGAWNPATWVAWLLLLLLATAIGLFSLRYGLPEVPAPADLPSFVSHSQWLVAHAVSASVALILGPWQLVPRLRRWSLASHRWTGRAYGLAVLVGGVTAFPVATNAAHGSVSSLGFMVLGVAWLATTVVGIARAMQGRVPEHRRWMVRSYALAAAAITLRLMLGASKALDLPMHVAYPAIAWLCWVPNWLAVEAWLRGPRDYRPRPVVAAASHGRAFSRRASLSRSRRSIPRP